MLELTWVVFRLVESVHCARFDVTSLQVMDFLDWKICYVDQVDRFEGCLAIRDISLHNDAMLAEELLRLYDHRLLVPFKVLCFLLLNEDVNSV